MLTELMEMLFTVSCYCTGTYKQLRIPIFFHTGSDVILFLTTGVNSCNVIKNFEMFSVKTSENNIISILTDNFLFIFQLIKSKKFIALDF